MEEESSVGLREKSTEMIPPMFFMLKNGAWKFGSSNVKLCMTIIFLAS
jgi:hypothetical protein